MPDPCCVRIVSLREPYVGVVCLTHHVEVVAAQLAAVVGREAGVRIDDGAVADHQVGRVARARILADVLVADLLKPKIDQS